MDIKGTDLGVRGMEVELEISSILAAPGPSKLSPFVANSYRIFVPACHREKRYYKCFCCFIGGAFPHNSNSFRFLSVRSLRVHFIFS